MMEDALGRLPSFRSHGNKSPVFQRLKECLINAFSSDVPTANIDVSTPFSNKIST
jgi:hypothetical protein